MNSRVVPKKNYLILLFMIILIVIITFTIFNLYNNYNDKKIETSYMEEKISEVNIDDLNDVIREASTEMFIYVTKTNDEQIYKFETKLYKILKNKDLTDNFIFLDVTKKEKEINEINKLLKSDIDTIPAIIYYKNGEFISKIDSKEKMITVSDFEQLLDEYELAN